MIILDLAVSQISFHKKQVQEGEEIHHIKPSDLLKIQEGDIKNLLDEENLEAEN